MIKLDTYKTHSKCPACHQEIIVYPDNDFFWYRCPCKETSARQSVCMVVEQVRLRNMKIGEWFEEWAKMLADQDVGGQKGDRMGDLEYYQSNSTCPYCKEWVEAEKKDGVWEWYCDCEVIYDTCREETVLDSCKNCGRDLEWYLENHARTLVVGKGNDSEREKYPKTHPVKFLERKSGMNVYMMVLVDLEKNVVVDDGYVVAENLDKAIYMLRLRNEVPAEELDRYAHFVQWDGTLPRYKRKEEE